MAELQNEFKWSLTRNNTFNTCKRLFYFRYYGMWNGWNENSSEEAKLCYRLSKMTNLHMLAGSVVHDIIQLLLESLKKSKTPRLDELKKMAISRLRIAWKKSKSELWLENPKLNANLFEHYYNKQISKEFTKGIKDKVLNSITNFYNSDLFSRIQNIDPTNWMTIEQFQEFKIQDYIVALKIDFALDDNGKLEIYDWKTGKEDESNIEQLICYALYGESKWGYSLDRISLKLFYLNDNNVEEHKVTSEQKGQLMQHVIQTYEEMTSLLEDPINNVAV